MLDVLRSLVSVATSGVVVANLNRKLFCKVHAAALGGREWDLLEDLTAHAEEAEKEQEEDIIDALLEASIAPSAGYSSQPAVVRATPCCGCCCCVCAPRPAAACAARRQC